MTRKETLALLNGLRKGRLPISDVYKEWPYKTYFFYPEKKDYYENETVPVSSEEIWTALQTYPKVKLFPVGISEIAVNEKILKFHSQGIEVFVPLPDPLTADDKEKLAESRRYFRKLMQGSAREIIEKEIVKTDQELAVKKEYKEMKERIDSIIGHAEEAEAFQLEKVRRQFKGENYDQETGILAEMPKIERIEVETNKPTIVEIPPEKQEPLPEEPPPRKIDYNECGSQRMKALSPERLGDMMRQSGVW